jgi:hypothetical protein
MMAMTEKETRGQAPIDNIFDKLKIWESLSMVWKAIRQWMKQHQGDYRESPIGKDDDGVVVPWFIRCNLGRYRYLLEQRVRIQGVVCVNQLD